MFKGGISRGTVSFLLIFLFLASTLAFFPFQRETAQAQGADSGVQTDGSLDSGEVIDSSTVAEDMFPDTKLPTPEEITRIKDPYTRTYYNADGTLSQDIFMAPINWQDEAGNWQEIKNDFVEDKKDGYKLRNEGNAFKVRLAEKTGGDKLFGLEVGENKVGLNLEGSGQSDYKGNIRDDIRWLENQKQHFLRFQDRMQNQMAKLETMIEALKLASTEEITKGKPNTALSTPSLEEIAPCDVNVEANQAYYAHEKDYSVEFITTSVVVEMLVKLNSHDAPNSFNFELDLKGLDCKKDDAGYIHFYSYKDGSEVFSLTPPVMMDSNFDPISGDPATSYDVTMDITKNKGGKAFLTITADPAWLSDSARVYPVIIDPAWYNVYPRYEGQSAFLHGDAFARSDYANNNYGCSWDSTYGYYQLRSGYNGVNHNRSIIGFDLRSFFHYPANDPTGTIYNLGAEIQEAKLCVYCYYSSSNPTPTWLYYATTDWAEDTVTWNNFPQKTYIGNSSTKSGQWLDFYLNTADVQRWVQGEENGGWKNRGIVLDENGSTDQSLYKKFASWENGIDHGAPRMTITYKQFGCPYNTDEVPVKFVKGESRIANVYVQNLGEEKWECFGTNPTNPVRLGYYITDRNGGNRQLEGRVELPRDIQSGEAVSLGVPVTVPAQAGEWRINFEPVKEGAFWFGERGVDPARIDIDVVDSAPSDPTRDGSARLGKLGWMQYASFPMGNLAGSMSVNLVTGNAVTSMTDLSVPGRGVPFSITRTYNSQAPDYSEQPTIFGPNWFCNLDVRVKEYESEGFLAFWDSQGTSYLLTKAKKENNFVSPEGAYFKAEKNPNYTNPGDSDDNKNWKYKVIETSGIAMNFDDAGRLRYVVDTAREIDDNNGDYLNYKNKLTITRNSNGMPNKITDASGRTFTITYYTDSYTRIKSISEDSWANQGGHAARTITYEYNAPGARLSKANLNPNEHWVKYLYVANNIISVEQRTEIGKKNTSYIEYDGNGKLQYFRDARSESDQDEEFKFEVDYQAGKTNVRSPDVSSSVPDYQNHKIKCQYIFDSVGHMATKAEGWNGTAFLGYTTYDWNACHQNWQVTNYSSPGTVLGQTRYTFDGKGNITRVEGDLNSSEQAVSTSDYATSSTTSSNPTQLTTPEGDNAAFSYNEGEMYFKAVDKAGAQSMTLRQLSNENDIFNVSVPANYRNLLYNPDFERSGGTVGSDWIGSGEVNGRSFAVNWSNEAPAGYRFQRIMVSGNTNTGSLYVYQGASAEPNTDYTVSFLYRNNDCVKQENQIIIRQYDSAGSISSPDLLFRPYRFSEWTPFSTSFKTSSNTAKIDVFLRTMITAKYQNAYTDFDTVQLHKGTRDTSFNRVENGDFERASGSGVSYWYESGANVTRSNEQSVSPGNSLKIENTGYVEQSINVKGSTKYLISGYVFVQGDLGGPYEFVDAYAVMPSSGSIAINLASALGYRGMGAIPESTDKWVGFCDVVTTGASDTTLTLHFYMQSDADCAYFDDIKLTRLPDDLSKTYDSVGNYVTSIQDPLGNVSHLTYDPVGCVTGVVDARAFQYQYGYNELNQIESVSDPFSSITEYTYDLAGRMVSYDDNLGKVTEFENNKLDKVTTKEDPLGQNTLIEYNEAGGIKSCIYPNGWEAYFAYDQAGRMEKAAWKDPNNPSELTIYSYTYDCAGNIISVHDNVTNKTINLSYDKASRLKSGSENYPPVFPFEIFYDYDKEGKLESAKYSRSTWGNGKTISYTYRDSGELHTISMPDGKSFDYLYDDEGRLSSITTPNNTAGSSYYSTTSFSYDALNRPEQVAHSLIYNGVAVKYEYDQVGNITKMSTRIWSTTTSTWKDNLYAYDGLNRLISWTDKTGDTYEYAYDANGNITAVLKNGSQEESYAFNDANQITNKDGVSFAYDNMGNLIDDGEREYVYGNGSRLKGIVDDEVEYWFTYDGLGRRVRKLKVDKVAHELGYTFYQYDKNGNVVCEHDDAGNIISSYVYDAAGHPVAFTQKMAGESEYHTYFLHTNAQGDVIRITKDNGVWVKKYEYDPWGVVYETPRDGYSEISCPFTYRGYFYDKETGLYYMPARYYSPTLRRFLTKDPHPGKKVNPQTLSPYQYCVNNPVNHADPTGQYHAAGGGGGRVSSDSSNANTGGRDTLVAGISEWKRQYDRLLHDVPLGWRYAAAKQAAAISGIRAKRMEVFINSPEGHQIMREIAIQAQQDIQNVQMSMTRMEGLMWDYAGLMPTTTGHTIETANNVSDFFQGIVDICRGEVPIIFSPYDIPGFEPVTNPLGYE